MAELLGLLAALTLLVLLVVVPILSFLRLARVSRDVEHLVARVARLEALQARPRETEATAPHSVPSASPFSRPSASEPLVHKPPPLQQPPPQDAPPAATIPDAAPESDEAPDEALEDRIGGRGLLYTGILVLLLGISFFLKYAFDNAWITETARVVLGALVGVLLVAGGLRLVRQGLDTFGQALAGAGFAVLYLVIYAALNFYALIDRGPAFLLMILVTGVAAATAHRERAQPLAFIAVGGGFLTPGLVGGGENAQLTLFSYLAVLVLGTMMLSFRHQWLALNVLSYVGTLVSVIAWASAFYTSDQWLRTLLFLTLYCVAFLIILRESRRQVQISARATSALLATAPVFYHLAAVVISAAHPPAIHIYLIAFTVVGLWFTVEPHRPLVRLAILLGAVVPMFGTITLPGGSSWVLPNVITIVSVIALHVMGLADRVGRQDERLRPADLVGLHAAGLALFALLYETLLPVWPNFRGGLALAVAAGALTLWRWLRTRDRLGALHALTLAFVLVAIGIGVEFDGATAIIGWSAEAVAVVWLGARAQNRGFLFGGIALWVIAAFELFDTFGETPAGFTAILNAGTFATAFVVVCGYVMAWRLRVVQHVDVYRLRAAIYVIASALTLGWMTAEIQSFWAVRYERPQAYLYEQMVLSLAWGMYGAALIGIGMARSNAVHRYIGMVVIGATSVKVFFYDLWELGGIYRVIGFLGFGVLLVLVSYLYQTRRARRRPGTPHDTD